MGNRFSVKNNKVYWKEELIYLDDDIFYNSLRFLDKPVS
jgi:hypothetical protein